MNTSKEKATSDIFQISDKIEFEKEILHFAFIHLVQNNMKQIKSYQLAKKVGVSSSFISQLFSGDKIVSLELLVKFQRALGFKFDVQATPNKSENVATEKTIGQIEFNSQMSQPSRTTPYWSGVADNLKSGNQKL